MVDKRKVKKLLSSLETINPNEVSTKDDKLDFDKLFKRADVKQVIKQLKEIGVTGKYLQKHFTCAWWVLASKFK